MFAKDPAVKTGIFFSCECIGKTADGIKFLGDLEARAVPGSLETHMLYKMGNPVFRTLFVTGAPVHPDTQGNGSQMFQSLR